MNVDRLLSRLQTTIGRGVSAAARPLVRASLRDPAATAATVAAAASFASALGPLAGAAATMAAEGVTTALAVREIDAIVVRERAQVDVDFLVDVARAAGTLPDLAKIPQQTFARRLRGLVPGPAGLFVTLVDARDAAIAARTKVESARLHAELALFEPSRLEAIDRALDRAA